MFHVQLALSLVHFKIGANTVQLARSIIGSGHLLRAKKHRKRLS